MVFLLTLLIQLFLSSMTSGKHKLFTDYNWVDYLNLFWNYENSGQPICFQFWFIQDLMVVVLFTPIINYIIKYCKIWGVFVLGVLWIFNLWFYVPEFNITLTAFFFFSFGAWLSLTNMISRLIFVQCLGLRPLSM